MATIANLQSIPSLVEAWQHRERGPGMLRVAHAARSHVTWRAYRQRLWFAKFASYLAMHVRFVKDRKSSTQ